MFTVSNDELEKAPNIGETIICKKCNKEHKIEYGEEILPDGLKVSSKVLAFYRCGDNTYLAGVNGKSIIK